MTELVADLVLRLEDGGQILVNAFKIATMEQNYAGHKTEVTLDIPVAYSTTNSCGERKGVIIKVFGSVEEISSAATKARNDAILSAANLFWSQKPK